VTRRRSIWLAIPAIVLAIAVGYGLFAHQAPSGQPPLATMDLAALKADFNAAHNQTRIIVLLSPT